VDFLKVALGINTCPSGDSPNSLSAIKEKSLGWANKSRTLGLYQ
jgi:hypothetical protein